MRSTIRLGNPGYRRVFEAHQPRLFDLSNDHDVPPLSEEEITRWVSDGGACLIVSAYRLWSRQPADRFVVVVNGTRYVGGKASAGITFLLAAGDHALSSPTRAPRQAALAVVSLVGGETVGVRYRGGPIDVQTGRWDNTVYGVGRPPVW